METCGPVGASLQSKVRKILDTTIIPETAQQAFDEMTAFLISGYGMTDEQARRQVYQSLFGGEQRQIQIEEAARLYRERGWIQVYSGHLGASIYLVKDLSIQTPDPGMARYTKDEVLALGGLSLEEVLTLHEAKVIFGGKVLPGTASGGYAAARHSARFLANNFVSFPEENGRE